LSFFDKEKEEKKIFDEEPEAMVEFNGRMTQQDRDNLMVTLVATKVKNRVGINGWILLSVVVARRWVGLGCCFLSCFSANNIILPN
jgi:hypothetical protein